MVSGRHAGGSTEESHSRNPNSITHLPKSTLKTKVENRHRIKLLPVCKDELETLIRKVVREVVNEALLPHVLLQRSEAEPSATRRYHLCLVCRIPNRVFTGNIIEAEGYEGAQPLKVVLQDATTGAVISNGPLSSMRLEVVVLQGDFKAEEGLIWTEKEFNDNVLLAREGKRPLLLGERYVTLKNGVAFFQDLSISDNSSWVRSKKFRLGVKVAQGPFSDVGVMEAVSGPFEVKDKRGEPYKKHPTPSLGDEVWRLYKIAKDGIHSIKLAANGIHRVKDFLQRYYTDESFLRSILQVSNNTWDAIVAHAKSSRLNNDHYSYFNAEEGAGLLFNCVLNIVGVTYDGQNYWPMETLTVTQKSQVERLKLYAYANQSQLIPVDVPATANTILSPCELTIPSTRSSLTDLHQLDIQDQPKKDMNFGYPECPFLYLLGVEDTHYLNGLMMNDQPVPVSSSMSDMSTEFYNDEPIWLPNNPSSSSGLFLGDDNIYDFQTSSQLPDPPNSGGQGSGLLVASIGNLHRYISSSS